MKTLKTLAAIALIAVAFASCKKDKENPIITVVIPAEHDTYTMGEELHMEAVFTDDKDLATYRVFIGDEAGTPGTDFSYMDEGTVMGTNYSYHAHTTIPMGIGMMYYLHFECTDAEGKAAEPVKLMLHFGM